MIYCIMLYCVIHTYTYIYIEIILYELKAPKPRAPRKSPLGPAFLGESLKLLPREAEALIGVPATRIFFPPT